MTTPDKGMVKMTMVKLTTLGKTMVKMNTLRQKRIKMTIPNLTMGKVTIVKMTTPKSTMVKLTTPNKGKSGPTVVKMTTPSKLTIPKMTTLQRDENITRDDLLKVQLLVSKIEHYIFSEPSLSTTEKELLRAILLFAPDSNVYGYGQFEKAMNNVLSKATIKRTFHSLKSKGYIIDISKQGGRSTEAPYFESLVQLAYSVIPNLQDIMPMSRFVHIVNNLPYQIYKVLDNVCMYVCNSNFGNIQTYSEPKQKNKTGQIEDELTDLIFKAHLLGVDYTTISKNVFKQLYKLVSLPPELENAKEWQKQTHIITVKNDLLYSIYYMLKQKNVKHPWNYTIKIYKEGLYDNLTQEQKQELDKLLKDIQNLQDESYLYDEVTKKEILEKISRFNISIDRFSQLSGPALRKELIKYFNELKQSIRKIIEYNLI